MTFEKVDPKNFDKNIFKALDDDWLLISAEKDGRTNPMTIAWGQAGMMWNKPVFIAAVRPERFTDSFIQASDKFTISGFEGEAKDILSYCGKESGRNVDKIKETGLELKYKNDAPYYENAKFNIICRKIAQLDLKEENILESDIVNKWYTSTSGHGGGYHNIYIGEIEEILVKK